MTTPTTRLELRTSRHLPATPEDVFDAYTDAEKQKIWFTILGDEPGIVEIEVDLRVGGKQVAAWGPGEDALFRETQTFLEIDRPHRLVTESVGSTPDGATITTHITVTSEADGDGTLMSVHQSGFPVPEVRDYFATEAWGGALARIEAYLRAHGGDGNSRTGGAEVTGGPGGTHGPAVRPAGHAPRHRPAGVPCG